MRITKFVNVDVEVDVEVSSEDIPQIFSCSVECSHDFLMILNRFYSVMKNMPDHMIKSMTEKQREITKNFFIEQSKRFSNAE